MMQNGRINSPNLDLACPQAKTDIKKYVHVFREREREVSIKTKYGHRSIMYIIITSTNFIIDFSLISNNSSQHRSIKHKLYLKSTNNVLSQHCNYNSSSFQEGSHIGAFWQVHIVNHHILFYDC